MHHRLSILTTILSLRTIQNYIQIRYRYDLWFLRFNSIASIRYCFVGGGACKAIHTRSMCNDDSLITYPTPKTTIMVYAFSWYSQKSTRTRNESLNEIRWNRFSMWWNYSLTIFQWAICFTIHLDANQTPREQPKYS